MRVASEVNPVARAMVSVTPPDRLWINSGATCQILGWNNEVWIIHDQEGGRGSLLYRK